MESNHYTGRRKVGGIVPVFTTRLTQILNIKIKEDQRGVHREGGEGSGPSLDQVLGFL